MFGKTTLGLAGACALAISLSAAQTVDFTQTAGKIRRELHSSGFGPMVCSCSQQAIDDIKSMNMLMARTHDWALLNSAERVCDYYHIFPLMHLDAKDPKNYHFGPTDYLLKRAREEVGLDIFYRLGTSIEHSGTKVHFNSLIPEDFDKVAETFAGTIRHYNHGWANGYKWNIRYWELWNEPDGTHNMWCEPGGDEPQNEARRRQKFVRFFVTCLKRLKSEFPEVKVGGPALCWMNAAYFKELLAACKESGVAPDFISWHSYSQDPDAIMKMADDARAICDSYGFTKCELIINEWHYFGNYTWGELRSSDPKTQAKVLDGPRAHNGIESAAFTLATLARFQTSKYDQAYYYGCRHVGSWGFKDSREQKYKTYYALKLFGSLVRDYPVLCGVAGGRGAFTTLAAKAADGRGKALLVVDFKAKQGRRIALDVKGAEGQRAWAVALDQNRNLAPCKVRWESGELVIDKEDDEAAAFLVKFADEIPPECRPVDAGWQPLGAKGKEYLALAGEDGNPVYKAFRLDRDYADGTLRLSADLLAPVTWSGAPCSGTTLRVGLAPDKASATFGEFGPDFQADQSTVNFALTRNPKTGHAAGQVMGRCQAKTWYRYVVDFDLAAGTYSGTVTEAATGKACGSFKNAPFCRHAQKGAAVKQVVMYGKGMTSGVDYAFDKANAGGVDNLKLEWKAPGAADFKTVFTCDGATTTCAGKTAPLAVAARKAEARLEARIDFAAETGRINKWLHCAGWGPRSYPRSLWNDDADIKAMNLTAGRTHDWALINSGQRVVDTQYIFPILELDAKDPKNYVFEPTDHVLELMRNLGMEVFYRMGTSIEHTGNWGINTRNPADHEKYAEALAGIVRHYNKGWANGFQWNIQNWEIYNEPNITPCWRGTKEEFIHLFITCLKRLKSEFPEISVGGPAFAGCPVDYMKDLLKACKAAGVAPDFLSWHYYGQYPQELVAQPAKIRALLDGMGFTKCKTVINEWHYIISWDGIHGASSSDKVKKAWSGPSAHNGIDSAVFNLAVLTGFQNSPLDQSYYYGSGAEGAWGWKNGMGQYNKCFYSMKLFGSLVKDYARKVKCTSSKESVSILAGLSADGKKGFVLLADYRGKGSLYADVAGVANPKNVKAVVLDHTRDLEPVEVEWSNGRLSFPRRDSNSVAYFVTFDLR